LAEFRGLTATVWAVCLESATIFPEEALSENPSRVQVCESILNFAVGVAIKPEVGLWEVSLGPGKLRRSDSGNGLNPERALFGFTVLVIGLVL
jgi:hypothetical protein